MAKRDRDRIYSIYVNVKHHLISRNERIKATKNLFLFALMFTFDCVWLLHSTHQHQMVSF